MKRFLGMGALALVLASVPTQQADAWVNCQFGVGFNFSFECSGREGRCGPGCFGRRCQQPHYIATFPGFEQHAPPVHQPFPPPPNPEKRNVPPGERNREEAAFEWGYPNLNYSLYRPVSYYPTQAQPSYYQPNYYPPAYYPPQPSYPANYGYPSQYPSPGITFDR
jgi:hypothetical protein